MEVSGAKNEEADRDYFLVQTSMWGCSISGDFSKVKVVKYVLEWVSSIPMRRIEEITV